MNRTLLVILSALFLACAAHAEPPKADAKPAPARPPIVVYNTPEPIAVVCTLTPDGDKLTYARGPAYAALSCGDYGRQLQQIEARFGVGATFIAACVKAEPCFAENAAKAGGK